MEDTAPEETKPLRVNNDDLDTDWVRMFYDGVPFTGVGYDLHRVEGYVVSEEEYRDGFTRGWVRSYQPDGQIEYEYHQDYGVTDGPCREWHPDGRLKSEGLFEHGVRLWRKEWDEQGVLTQDWRLTEQDPQWAELMRWREAVRRSQERADAAQEKAAQEKAA